MPGGCAEETKCGCVYRQLPGGAGAVSARVSSSPDTAYAPVSAGAHLRLEGVVDVQSQVATA